MEALEQVLEDAQRAGLVEQVGAHVPVDRGRALDVRRYDVAADRLAKGLEYCSDHGLELFRLYLLSCRARLYLAQGRWAQAAETADMVLRIPRTSINPRITALTVLGLVRARRGDPGHRPLLDEAWDLAQPTGEVCRLGPVAAARAEAAWLECDPDGVASATELALALALKCSPALADELGVWRHRAGLGAAKPAVAAFAAWSTARRAPGMRPGPCGPRPGAPTRPPSAWPTPTTRRGCGWRWRSCWCSRPARRLRSWPDDCANRGVMSLPRGPRATTRQNQYGLTAREVEVLALLNEGLQNSQIADRLVVSVRTVDHHVEAILRKLGAKTPRRRPGHRHLARDSCGRPVS